MSILSDKLPDFVLVRGIKNEVNTSFRVWLKFDQIRKKGINKDTASEIFTLCYKDELPPSAREALLALGDFFAPDRQKRGKETDGAGKRCFDFEADSKYIYAAFLSEYGLDLQKEDIHWHTFCALLGALSESSKFMQIVSYRTADISKIKTREQKSFIKKMQRLYALPDERSEQDKDKAFAEALWKI